MAGLMYENSLRAACATHDLYLQRFSPSSTSLESMFSLVPDRYSTGFYRKWEHSYISNKGQYLLAEYERVRVCIENGVMSHQKERSGWRVLEWASMTFCDWCLQREVIHRCIWIEAYSQVQCCQSLSDKQKMTLKYYRKSDTKMDKTG